MREFDQDGADEMMREVQRQSDADEKERLMIRGQKHVLTDGGENHVATDATAIAYIIIMNTQHASGNGQIRCTD